MSQFNTEDTDSAASFDGIPYDYSSKIKSPVELGMSDDGTMGTISDNMYGIKGYINALISGSGKAIKNTNDNNLGNRYFLTTVQKCKDTNGKSQTRSIYIDNVTPNDQSVINPGSMSSIATSGEMRGLIPGVLNNIRKINPSQIMGGLKTTGTPECIQITAKTLDNNGNQNQATRYVTADDLKYINDDAIISGKSGFQNHYQIQNTSKYSKKIFVNMYILSVSVLFMYIFLKILKKS